jgi:hypothetical protein
MRIEIDARLAVFSACVDLDPHPFSPRAKRGATRPPFVLR